MISWTVDDGGGGGGGGVSEADREDTMRCCIDRFDTTSDIPPRRRTYEAIKQRVLEAGRFSVFEATESTKNAALFTRLHSDPELALDNTRGYPWIYVMRRTR